jgi:hypothetical protein
VIEVCRFSEAREVHCGDGLDNDCDGLVDAAVSGGRWYLPPHSYAIPALVRGQEYGHTPQTASDPLAFTLRMTTPQTGTMHLTAPTACALICLSTAGS